MSKVIDYEIGATSLKFIREDRSVIQVETGSMEAARLFEEVKANRLALGLDGFAPEEAGDQKPTVPAGQEDPNVLGKEKAKKAKKTE